MNTIQKTLKKDNFFYQAGSVITTKAWYMPTYENVEQLLNDISQQNYPYDLYLVGGVANGKIGNTFDIDIVATGMVIYDEFEAFLHDIYDLALNKHRLLVDVRWIDKPIEKLQYLVNNNEYEAYKSIRFGYYFKKSLEEVLEINLFEKFPKISDYMIEKEVVYPTEKSINCINHNYVKI